MSPTLSLSPPLLNENEGRHQHVLTLKEHADDKNNELVLVQIHKGGWGLGKSRRK